MPITAARAVLRQSRFVLRRAAARSASTTSEAANAVSSTASKAKDTVSNVTSKASEGLTKVTSSAGSSISQATSATTDAAGRASGRIGRLVSTVQSLIPPTVYYSKVAFEVTKIVFKGQGMAPPSMSHLQAYYQPILSGLRNPTNAFAHSHGIIHPQEWLNRIRNMKSQDAIYAGVIVAELLGFFTVGEMLGKLKVVGYKGEVEHHH